MSGKIKSGDTICCICIIVFIFASCFMPKTGKLVLLDEVFKVLLLWLASGYIIVKIIISQNMQSMPQKVARIMVIIACSVVSLWCAKSVVLDMINGTKEVTMSDCTVSMLQGKSGIISRHYYLEGMDENGKRMKMEISAKDYTALLHKESVRVEYYCYTDRITEFW